MCAEQCIDRVGLWILENPPHEHLPLGRSSAFSFWQVTSSHTWTVFRAQMETSAMAAGLMSPQDNGVAGGGGVRRTMSFSIGLSVYLSICLSVYPFICLCVALCVASRLVPGANTSLVQYANELDRGQRVRTQTGGRITAQWSIFLCASVNPHLALLPLWRRFARL